MDAGTVSQVSPQKQIDPLFGMDLATTKPWRAVETHEGMAILKKEAELLTAQLERLMGENEVLTSEAKMKTCELEKQMAMDEHLGKKRHMLQAELDALLTTSSSSVEAARKRAMTSTLSNGGARQRAGTAPDLTMCGHNSTLTTPNANTTQLVDVDEADEVAGLMRVDSDETLPGNRTTFLSKHAEPAINVLENNESKGNWSRLTGVDVEMVLGSGLGFSRIGQVIVFGIALALVVFVLAATATGFADDHFEDKCAPGYDPDIGHGAAAVTIDMDLHAHLDLESGVHHDTSQSPELHTGGAHRRLVGAKPSSSTGGGAAGRRMQRGAFDRRLGGGVSPLLRNIAFCMTAAGIAAFLVNFLNLPLVLGYLFGGYLVGPSALCIVYSHTAIAELSSLGLVFLLFMIGLELDVRAIFKMGRDPAFAGLVQFPVCAIITTFVLWVFEAAFGVSWGDKNGAGYIGVSCGLSSTLLVVKMLSDQADMESPSSRCTVGVLIAQDIWAVLLLGLQPNIDVDPASQGRQLLYSIGWISVLGVVSVGYAKYVMPAVFFISSQTTELMLVLSLAWCFFISCLAVLPFIDISMEVASLIAGVALASFPYSSEFNGKVRYIRDFFVTLFFVSLGMQIPKPWESWAILGKAAIVIVVVPLVRWLGVFFPIYVVGGQRRTGAIATINLSQVSEFTLVVVVIGVEYGHIEAETLTIVIYTYAVLTVVSSVAIKHSHWLYRTCAPTCRSIFGHSRKAVNQDELDELEGREIVLLGFHRIASMLIHEFEAKSPQFLKKIHVIDFNESIVPKLKDRGVTCSYGDFSQADVLKDCHQGKVSLVISTIPDAMLRGIDNAQILQTAMQVWPEAHFIVTADNPEQAKMLYDMGANYVVRMAKLCAERLHVLLTEHVSDAFGGELNNIFKHYKLADKDHKLTDVFHLAHHS